MIKIDELKEPRGLRTYATEPELPEVARREAFKEVGKWLESTITDETPERLDEPFPVKVTGLDILRMRDAGLLPKATR